MHFSGRGISIDVPLSVRCVFGGSIPMDDVESGLIGLSGQDFPMCTCT